VARLVPLAWRYSDATRARILLDDTVYESKPFEDAPLRLSTAIVANGVTRGRVEVAYVKEWWARGEEPFEAEEQYLLDSIARTLGEAIERREAEGKLRNESNTLARERNRLETILRGIGEGVVVTDSLNRVLLMNRAAQNLLGTVENEPIGEDFLSLIADESFLDIWRATALQGRDFAKQELHIDVPEAKALSVTRSSVPELSEGRPGFVAILHDVTKEREIDQMKSDFVSAVSHELRTPLTSIKGFAVTLRSNPKIEPELRHRFLGIIAEEADRLATLVEELLIMSRIESGRMVLGQEPVDLGALVRYAIDAFQPEADKRNVALEAEIPPDLAKPIGDREKIRVIVANLVENAVKFTSQGGTVRVRASQDQNEVRLEVADTGIGIPKAEQQRIFERFYRVRRPGHTEPGTGLGLFIVREMVTLHGGHIEVDSAEGGGSVFSVFLPLRSRGGETVQG
jgi:two-component system phosphate regulon sensor histidine kinase PhoR